MKKWFKIIYLYGTLTWRQKFVLAHSHVEDILQFASGK